MSRWKPCGRWAVSDCNYDVDVGERFLQTDPIGYADQMNLYAYVGNDPVNNADPTGTECINNSDGTTNCTTDNYDVTVPTPDGFPGTDASNKDTYHEYNETAESSKGVDETRQFVKDNPTPGNPDPATPQGTRNDATPVIGGVGPEISPVTSNVTVNKVTGNEVVVNVTLPGHPLFPGIVVREVTSKPDGSSTISNRGEGNGSLQKPGAPFAKLINSVWRFQKP